MAIRIPVDIPGRPRMFIDNFDEVGSRLDQDTLHLFRDLLSELEEGSLDARQRSADERIGRLISSAFSDFQGNYSRRALESLDILERYAAIREDIAANRVVDDSRVRQLLEDLRELDQERLDTPEAALRQEVPTPENYPQLHAQTSELEVFIAGRVRQVLHRSPLGGAAELLAQMDGTTQEAVLRALEQEPDLVRRAIVEESGPEVWSREAGGLEAAECSALRPARRRLANAMRERGMGADEMRRLGRAVVEMNRRHIGVRERVEREMQSQALEELLNQAPDHRFREVVTRAIKGSTERRPLRYFEPISRDAPEMVLDLYINYRDRQIPGTFRNYVRRLMASHYRGMAGEFTAAFQLGAGMTLLKGPDYDVTIPGTDLVGVCDITGDIWLIDNKAFTGEEVRAVDALTRNIRTNLERDVSEFQAALEGRTDIPPELSNAVQRLENAMNHVREHTDGMTPAQVNRREVQQEIDGILDRFRIRRVVSNAHGNVNGLSSALRTRGIELENLNAILERGHADRIADYFKQFTEEEIDALVELIGNQ